MAAETKLQRRRSYRAQRCGSARATFPKESRVRQGAIVENKLLGHTLTVIRELQNLRDENTFNSRPLTLREEDFLRRSMGESGRHDALVNGPAQKCARSDARPPNSYS
jgi:hypothetical protein